MSLSREYEEWEQLEAREVIDLAYRRWGKNLVLSSSFGAEDMVLIDMACEVVDRPEVFCLDTDLLFRETQDLIDLVCRRYPIRLTRYKPRLTVTEQAHALGDRLWEREPDQCCGIRKVEPLRRALTGKDAWMTGIRRDQSPTRKNAPVAGWDESHALMKINPLVQWTTNDVFFYLQQKSVPYNVLHDQGYPSIGCEPCTRAVKSGEDPRAGRWAGHDKKECGIHQ